MCAHNDACRCAVGVPVRAHSDVWDDMRFMCVCLCEVRGVFGGLAARARRSTSSELRGDAR